MAVVVAKHAICIAVIDKVALVVSVVIVSVKRLGPSPVSNDEM
jgi:hypothetical protein